MAASSRGWGVVALALFGASLPACDAGPAQRGDAALPGADASARDAAADIDAAHTGHPDAGAPPAAVAADAALNDAALNDAALNDAALNDAAPRDPVEDAGHDAALPTGGPDAGSLAVYVASPLASPPSYLGNSGTSEACTQSFPTLGYAPADGAERFPLFVYFVGTSGSAADQSARYDGKAPDRVTKAMAERGFVALSVAYDNTLGALFTNKLPCLFGAANASSLFARACALPNVDCARGIATWGHSQGGLLAHGAADLDARVRAVWATGYSGARAPKLPPERLRVVNGEADTYNAAAATANAAAGFTGSAACADGSDTCLRGDGSGWIVVRKRDSASNAADHCWFNKLSCADNAETLEPRWLDPASPMPFALAPNADWVARTVARP